MTAKQAASRLRIDNTKAMSLDNRIAILEVAACEVGEEPDLAKLGKKVSKWLTNHGYEPMMFSAACRVWLSRQRQVQHGDVA